MVRILFSITLFVLAVGSTYGQEVYAGFTSLELRDTARIYKPETEATDKLHFRPVDLDIWYPSLEKAESPLAFGDLFGLFEQRAVNYQDNHNYSGITEELAQFYVAELGAGDSGEELLTVETSSFQNPEPSKGNHPIIVYMAGYNGMGFENYKILERLAQSGFVVISIWSVGRYPGDMTNKKEDMMQQVFDAEFAVEYLRHNNYFNADLKSIGVLGCSWGGMSAGVFIERNPEVKAFASLDGTETHYFGEEEESDSTIRDIHNARLLKPETSRTSYVYLESGDKLSEFKAVEQYNYFERLNTTKYYLRFARSTHADFTSIPSILESSQSAIDTYSTLSEITLAFFNKYLKNAIDFDSVWKRAVALDNTLHSPYVLSENPTESLVFEGNILDRDTKVPLPYVNIGILNREIGTVSDTAGHFSLLIDSAYIQDTIRFSSIGYRAIEKPVSSLLNNREALSIGMEEQISELDEVIVTAKALREKTFGNKTQSKFLSTGFSYDQLGAEMGIKINIRKGPVFVNRFNFHISYNRLSAKSVFRLNIYSVVKNKPDRNLLKENILIPIEPKQTGEISVDLQPYNITLNEDVIVALQWVETQGNTHKDEAIFFSLGMFNSGTLYKKSSQAKFKKFNSMGVGFNIDTRY